MTKPPTATIALAIAILAAGTASPQDEHRAAPAVKDVMTTMTVPASDAIFSAAAEPPERDSQWVALRASAATLAESGRLLATMDRAQDDAEWLKMARALVTGAEATFKAIDAKDVDTLVRASDTLYLTCETCHDRYFDR